MSHHLVLLGDSIFDNTVYVDPGCSVSEHLAEIAQGMTISLVAVDGHMTRDMHAQFGEIPEGATHLALSIGGNDALNCVRRLTTPCTDIMGALSELSRIRAHFRKAYRGILEKLLEHRLPILVCTIYEEIPGLSDELKTALALFNEAILAEAARAQVAILDLRLLCRNASDYSDVSPIEPSSTGGRKIATALIRIVDSWDTQDNGGRIHV